MIPLHPHRTKGPGVLGATPDQPVGPFGRWPEPGDAEDDDTEADPQGACLPAPTDKSDR